VDKFFKAKKAEEGRKKLGNRFPIQARGSLHDNKVFGSPSGNAVITQLYSLPRLQSQIHRRQYPNRSQEACIKE
jgi:hypothetical protein